jgi:hypothetical protein
MYRLVQYMLSPQQVSSTTRALRLYVSPISASAAVSITDYGVSGERKMNANFSQINTAPGACGSFGAPEGFTGDQRQYQELLRSRYLQRGHSQIMAVLAMQCSRGLEPEYTGPYAASAKAFVDTVAAELNSPAATVKA